MLVEEAVNAKLVYEYVEGEEERQVTFVYRKALQNSGISSNSSWNYVGANRDEENMKKLEINLILKSE